MTIAWSGFPSAVALTGADVLVGLAGGTTNARFLGSSILLVAGNLSNVANAATSFGNISPLTTKGDILWFNTSNSRLPIGTLNQILAVGASSTVTWVNNPGLLIANNLSDVASSQASFNHISQLTTKGDIVWFDGTNSTRLAVGTLNQILAVGAAGALGWTSTPTFTSITTTGTNTASTTNAITAHSGGGQGSAVALTTTLNRITTVAASGDSVKLPAAIAGKVITVINAAATNPSDCFPSTGDAINALSANTAFSIVANKTVSFSCAVTGIWNSILSA